MSVKTLKLLFGPLSAFIRSYLCSIIKDGSYAPLYIALFNFKADNLCSAAMKVYQELWLKKKQENLFLDLQISIDSDRG